MQDYTCTVKPAKELEFKDGVVPESRIIDIVSHYNQTAMLTADGQVFTADHGA